MVRYHACTEDLIPSFKRAFYGLLLLAWSASNTMGDTVSETEAAALLMTNQSQYAPEAEALYMQRYNERFLGQASSGDASLGGYDPLTVVSGAQKVSLLPRTGKGAGTISKKALDAAESYAAERNSHALLVWRRGYIERETYFGEMSASSLIISFSLAKPISVIAVGRAIQEGFIESLDQPVADFFPEWRNTEKEGILVRHLLDMRSGLLPQSQDREPEHIMNRAYLHPFHEQIIINDYPLVHEPGSRYEYSNVTSDLIAPLIERSTGVQYEEWLSEELMVVLGAEGGRVWINRPEGMAHSACCALYPAETYLKLALLVLFEGTWEGRALLSQDFVRAMKTPTEQNIHAGMGLYIGKPYLERRGPLHPDKSLGRIYHSEPYAADDLVLFDGSANQVAYIIPSEELVILRLGRWPDKDRGWDNSILPNLIIQGIQDK